MWSASSTIRTAETGAFPNSDHAETFGRNKENEPNQQGSTAGNAGVRTDIEKPIGATVRTEAPGWNVDEKDHRRCERQYWRRTMFLTALAAAGAIGSAFFAFGAWRAGQTTANAAIESNRLALEANKLSDNTAKRQLRAYLYVSHGDWASFGKNREGGEQFGALLSIYHAGATPAYNIRLDATIEVGRYMVAQTQLSLGNAIAMQGGTMIKRQYAVLSGNKPIEEPIAVSFDADAMRSTKSTDPLIGDNRFYLHGIIRYLDIFGIENLSPEHRYELCFVFHPEREPSGTERGCEQHNKPG
jgi:hypothetical protein